MIRYFTVIHVVKTADETTVITSIATTTTNTGNTENTGSGNTTAMITTTIKTTTVSKDLYFPLVSLTYIFQRASNV